MDFPFSIGSKFEKIKSYNSVSQDFAYRLDMSKSADPNKHVFGKISKHYTLMLID